MTKEKSGEATGGDTTGEGLANDPVLERPVHASQAGMRLDVFLTQQEEVASRSLAKVLVKGGQVRVNGRPCKPGQFLEAGQVVRFDPKVETEHVPGQPADRVETAARLQLLHEDSMILVLNKAAGMNTHPPNPGARRPAGRVDGPSLADLAVARYPDLPRVGGKDRPGVVHRLDRETSGVMVMARNEEAFHFLKGQFKSRQVKKEYRAIAYGEPRFDSDYVEHDIAIHPRRGDRMTVVREGGREALTYYEVLERFVGFCYLACHPRTGRTHQIRVHMMSVGHSLVGDRLYCSRRHSQAELPEGAPNPGRPGRHCLHARRLSFLHPRSRQPVSFEAPLPEDMDSLLGWLRQNRGLDPTLRHPEA